MDSSTGGRACGGARGTSGTQAAPIAALKPGRESRHHGRARLPGERDGDDRRNHLSPDRRNRRQITGPDAARTRTPRATSTRSTRASGAITSSNSALVKPSHPPPGFPCRHDGHRVALVLSIFTRAAFRHPAESTDRTPGCRTDPATNYDSPPSTNARTARSTGSPVEMAHRFAIIVPSAAMS